MTIYAMNDCDWMAGESLESVKTLYLAENAGGLPEDEALDEPHELNDHEMDRLRFHDDDAENPDDYRTFRQELNRRIANGDKFPCFFASTEY